jgi:hypothetical protein
MGESPAWREAAVIMPRARQFSRRKRPADLAVQRQDNNTTEPRTPFLPHERDESAAHQAKDAPDPVAVQGHEDVSKGLMDTDRRQDANPVFESARRRNPRGPR